MATATELVQETARRLLGEGTVKVVIGYTKMGEGWSAATFVTKPEQCARLIFDETCFANLTMYLTKPEVVALGRPAIVSKGCDNRSLNLLISEKKISREDVHVIGVECPGMDKTVCTWCNQHAPVNFDELIPADTPPVTREIPENQIASMSPQERWDFWMKEFARCIRCYGCRSVCPTCYCPTCLADKNQPQGIDTSPTPRGNLQWHLIRAFHHVGRCVECGECEHSCPMDIPLMDFMKSMQDVVRDKFHCEPGATPDQKSPLGTYSENDKEDFFR